MTNYLRLYCRCAWANWFTRTGMQMFFISLITIVFDEPVLFYSIMLMSVSQLSQSALGFPTLKTYLMTIEHLKENGGEVDPEKRRKWSHHPCWIYGLELAIDDWEKGRYQKPQ
jgi:hypothetical protein